MTLETGIANYKPKTTMHMAFTNALTIFEPSTECTICAEASGTVSTSKGSNCSRAAAAAGFTDYSIFIGSRAGRRKTEGYRMLIVKSSGNKPKVNRAA
jgi:hypothetical protein